MTLPSSNVFAEMRLTENQALDLLRSRIQKDRLYSSWTTLSCLSFFIEKKMNDYIDIGIHEKHGGECPSDSNTWPIVDRFRIYRLTKKIQWYEPTEGEYLPYRTVLKAKLKK